LFGKLQQRKETIYIRERGGEEKQKRKGMKTKQKNKKEKERKSRKIQKGRYEGKQSGIQNCRLLLRLCLVIYSWRKGKR
jgi:hypothetical protein